MFEENNKDQKIFEIYKDAISSTTLIKRLEQSYILSFQLEKKHLEQLPKDFDLLKERAWILSKLSDLELNRKLNLREKVVSTQEGYQYFDNIEELDNPNNVFNYDKVLDADMMLITNRLLRFFANIIKTLDIEFDLGDLM